MGVVLSASPMTRRIDCYVGGRLLRPSTGFALPRATFRPEVHLAAAGAGGASLPASLCGTMPSHKTKTAPPKQPNNDARVIMMGSLSQLAKY